MDAKNAVQAQSIILSALLLSSTLEGVCLDLGFKESLGRGSQSTSTAEEDSNGKFTFRRHRVDIAAEEPATTLKADVTHHRKDYSGDGPDSTMQEATVAISDNRQGKATAYRAGGSFAWRQRKFDALPSQDYRQMQTGSHIKWDNGLEGEAAFTQIAYPHDTNQRKLSAKAKRRLTFSDWRLDSTAKTERHWASQRRKFKTEGALRATIDPDHPRWDHFSLALRAGQGDSKTLDGREDDVDFIFSEVSLFSRHPVAPDHAVTLETDYRSKRDTGAAYDHHGGHVESSWRHLAHLSQRRLRLEPFVGFKRMIFTETAALTYTKRTLGARAQLSDIGDWKLSGESKFDLYDHADERRSHTLMSNSLEMDRDLGALNLGFGLRNRGDLVSANAQVRLEL